MDIYDEHLHWLNILSHHLTFINDKLSISEEEVHNMVAALQMEVAGLIILATARDYTAVEQVTRQALTFAESVGDLKKEILSRQLLLHIKLDLEPTFLNHMVNELMEYITILKEFLIEGKVNPKHVLHHHKLWLLDIEGHLGYIEKELDAVEKELKKIVHDEKHKFHHLFNKTLEFIGYLRAQRDFPALANLTNEAYYETIAYLDFIDGLREGITNNFIEGRLEPLFLDHCILEQNYYLAKLKQYAL